jgi:hypothetical protein
VFRGRLTSATSATSEGAQGNFSKITFLKSVRSKEKDVVCHSFLVKIFTKSLHRGGVKGQVTSEQNCGVLNSPKLQRDIARISALATKMGQIRKIKAQYHAN